MVFARTKIMIHDWCFEEAPTEMFVNYAGPNPQLALKHYVESLKTVFKVRDSEIQEKNFNWDKSSKEEKFDLEFEVRKDMDKNSYLFIQGGLNGTIIPSEQFGKEGHLQLRITGAVRTEYPQDTFWQKSLIYEFFRVMYHKLIYMSLWEKYMAECREMVRFFLEDMKAYLNIIQRGGV